MSAKGEKYKSQKAMMKHEKTEPASQRMKEYGSKSKSSGKSKSMPKKKGK